MLSAPSVYGISASADRYWDDYYFTDDLAMDGNARSCYKSRVLEIVLISASMPESSLFGETEYCIRLHQPRSVTPSNPLPLLRLLPLSRSLTFPSLASGSYEIPPVFTVAYRQV